MTNVYHENSCKLKPVTDVKSIRNLSFQPNVWNNWGRIK